MIHTFFASGTLGTSAAFFAALAIGLAFGFALEKAGFGSSRRLAGIFYFRDMTVLKVMFTAVITAMLGLLILAGLGVIDLAEQIYLMPTIFGAQIVGGLIFGVGFVMGGWCPGTAAVGTASGRLDAVVFLAGAVGGSVAFNELYPLVEPLYTWGIQPEPLFAFGLPPAAFAVLFTLAAVGAFYFAEWAEKRTTGRSKYLRSPFLRTLSVALVIAAVAVAILPGPSERVAGGPFGPGAAGSEKALLESVEAAEDHFEPEALADRLVQGDPGLLAIDVRPAAEYEAFHLRGAVNVPIAELPDYLASAGSPETVVLYSTGMTHPAQARDSLTRLGYRNVYMLTDGLAGFVDRCLKPVSLRDRPLSADEAARVRAWRSYFLGEDRSAGEGVAIEAPGSLPGLVSTAWLAENYDRPGVRVIDVRSGPDYSYSHVPGSVRIDMEGFRGVVGGVQSMLLPADMLAAQLSLLGVRPSDVAVVVPGGKLRDATLVGMALDRVGHARWGILEGGFDRWAAEKRPLTAALSHVEPTHYPVPAGPDGFTVDYRAVEAARGDGQTVILDSRPADYFSGEKSDEARPGHIPGAINRPYSEDLAENGQLEPIGDLKATYEKLLPNRETPVIVHCRTGHQASQTYFVLKHVLGYKNVRWYDAGWTEWAALPDLPAETAGQG